MVSTNQNLSQQFVASGSVIPKDQAIKNIEDIKVTVRCYLLAVRFEKNTKPHDGKDNEFHLEIGATPNWKGAHAVVEVSTGQVSCNARKTAWNLALRDSISDKKPTTLRIFGNPSEVLVTGYTFIDGAHGHKGMTAKEWAESSGGRGIRFSKVPSQVKGLFEIHPITSLALTH